MGQMMTVTRVYLSLSPSVSLFLRVCAAIFNFVTVLVSVNKTRCLRYWQFSFSLTKMAMPF